MEKHILFLNEKHGKTMPLLLVSGRWYAFFPFRMLQSRCLQPGPPGANFGSPKRSGQRKRAVGRPGYQRQIGNLSLRSG